MNVPSIVDQLNRLSGLNVSTVRCVADMLVVHLGDIREVEGGTVGAFALHVQCPWRLEGPNGIITGYIDLLEEHNVALQEFPDQLVVQAATADAYGGAVIGLSGNYRLVLFPASKRGEHWRLFQPATDQQHFVVEDNRFSWE